MELWTTKTAKVHQPKQALLIINKMIINLIRPKILIACPMASLVCALNTLRCFFLATPSYSSEIASATTTPLSTFPRRSGTTYILFTSVCLGNLCTKSGRRPPQPIGSNSSEATRKIGTLAAVAGMPKPVGRRVAISSCWAARRAVASRWV